MDTNTGTRPLLLDRVLPDFRFTRLECTAIAAGPSRTYRAARDLDLLTIHSPLFDLVARARGLPDRLRGTPAPLSGLDGEGDLTGGGASASVLGGSSAVLWSDRG
jgi:hypothetical protein